MFKDPIVEEVRRIRDELAAKAGYDLDKIFKMLKASEKRSGRKFIHLPPKRITPAFPRSS